MNAQRPRTRGSRRGTVYLVLLSAAGVVVVLSLTGITLVRVQRRVCEANLAMMEARSAALSGMEHAAAIFDSVDTWRTVAKSAGGTLGSFTLGRSTVTVAAADPGGAALSAWALKPVEITSTATIGTTVQAYKARLQQEYTPLSCLATAMTSGDRLELDDTVLAATERIASNEKIDSNSCRIWAPVEAVAAIDGGSYNSTMNIRGARALPAPTVFSLYKAAGVEIALSALPNRTIENVVLGTNLSPYSAPANSTGVYWIECDDKDVTIRNCRIVGTLVLINVHTLTIEGSVQWTPPARGMPILLVDGKAKFVTQRTRLYESTINANLNPPGVPFNNASNATTTDSYPSVLSGLIYVSEDCSIEGDLAIEGQFIGGAKVNASKASIAITYDNGSYCNPPPGFSTATGARILAGTIEQVVFP